MFTWLKNKLSAQKSGTVSISPASRKVEAIKKGNYLLEPLEPRILLSADSIFGEVFRSLQDNEAQNTSNNLAIIIEEIDAALSSYLTTNNGNENLSLERAELAFNWPENWQNDASANDQLQSADEAGNPDSSIIQNSEDDSDPAGQAVVASEFWMIPTTW